MDEKFQWSTEPQQLVGDQGCCCHGEGHGEGGMHHHAHGMMGHGHGCGCGQDGHASLQHKVARMGLMLRRYHMLSMRDNGEVDASRGQGRVLKLLEAMPGASQRDLAYVLGMRPQSLSELLGKLEAKGLVSRQKSPDDARVTLVSLTEEGKAAVPSQSAAQDDAPLSVLTAEERAGMEAYVDKVSAELERRFAEMGDRVHAPGMGACHGGPHGMHGGPHGPHGMMGGHGGPCGHGGPHGMGGHGMGGHGMGHGMGGHGGPCGHGGPHGHHGMGGEGGSCGCSAR